MAQRRRSARRQAVRTAQAGQGAQKGPLARRQRASTAIRTIPKPFLVTGGLFLAVIIVLVLVNYWFSVKRPADEPFLQVNDTVFSWNDYVGLLRFQKLGAETLGGTFNAGTEPYQLIQSMAHGELIRQAAPREGLSVTDEAVRKETVSRLVDKPEQYDNPKQLDREFRVRLHNYLASVQLSRGDYNDLVKTDVLREQLRDKLGTRIPRVQPHVYLHLIRADDEKMAEVQKRLAAGEEFAAVARKLSSDDKSSKEGGVVGWVPPLVYKDFDTLLFGLRTGEVSEPLQTEKGVYLVKLVERVGDGARLQAILVKDLQAARQVQDQFASGLSFGQLSAQHSIDPQLRASQGDLGLVRVGDHGGIFNQLVAGVKLGEVAGPLTTTEGIYLVKVTERTEAREVNEESLDVLKTRALEDWLQREWDQNVINYCPGGPDNCFGSAKVSRALSEIGNVAQTKVQEAATATAVAASQRR